ncbi:hypothetical protein [Jannaschia aquimarina]|uniref:Lipoprotein n=1 Tax=Jannaschia aquimarina TaxID=935700 RepID=A0A0D1ENZ0_9RHOB|nr:hypothetical protein [Jannaschia aquimarina]KIT17355.1 hypothetical protein jaqu_10870 [Jannaschia aquimarina]SNT20816.1 hypothetical protein SAMN05421775_107213 [Jannaschia aquimarina]
MRSIVSIVLCAAILGGCGLGGSRLNPLTWWGNDREEVIEAARSDPSTPIADQVIALNAAPTPGGVIVSAIALPPTQGYWDARLQRLPSDDPSVYVMEFQLLPPVDPEPVGTQVSREVLGGTFLTTQDLAGIRSITVQGAQNRRTISRQ